MSGTVNIIPSYAPLICVKIKLARIQIFSKIFIFYVIFKRKTEIKAMINEGKIYFAKSGKELEKKIYLEPSMAVRHGFIGGATGTGKTVTLKVLAESFSEMGVPVFFSDVKGDLSGMIVPGMETEDMKERIARFKLAEDGFSFKSFPAEFYDIFGQTGIPLRTTVSEMGPALLADVLELTETQEDILSVVFKIADDEELLLSDTKDLKAMLQYAAENSKEYELEYGRIAKQSVSAIVRAIVSLESEGGDIFFGEPAINVTDFFACDASGKGKINILDSRTLVNKPRLYSAFMLYLLSELFESLPEIGEVEKPRMVFFFDEAHLLFDNASKALIEKTEQIIKLIRSKGIGIFFITQSPSDIPDGVMSQLGNKIEHALRAYTPVERKAIKTAAQSFRENPDFDTEELLTQLGTGEALVSVLGEDGIPGVAEHAYILPPSSTLGTATEEAVKKAVEMSNLYLKYNQEVDPDSAYEFLERRKLQIEKEELEEKAEEEAEKVKEKAEKEAEKAKEKAEREAEKEAERQKKAIERSVKSVASTAAGSIGRQVGGEVGKKLFGSFGKSVAGNIGASLGRNILGTLFRR